MSENENNETIDPGEFRVYEVGYHLLSSVPEDRVSAEVGTIKEILEKAKAVVIAEELPKIRQLSYMMRKRISDKYQKFTTAYFGWVKFECNAEEALAIKEAFEKIPSMLRFIIVKTVRESTISVPRVIPYGKGEGHTEKHEVRKEEPKGPVSEAEIDKKLEELIAG